MRVLDLFSGIGGFSLGLERTGGFETVAFCEYEPFPRAVLAKHWPDVPCFPDVRELKGSEIGGSVDVICGGYPCQPFSTAGKRRGKKDDRHLWPEFSRLVAELRPTWVIGENVAGHISMGLDDVLSDLEGQGYACRAFVIPACAVDAPHRRDRVWAVAFSDRGNGQPSESERPRVRPAADRQGADADLGGASAKRAAMADANDAGLQRRQEAGHFAGKRTRRDQQPERRADMPGTAWLPEPNVGRVAHGVSRRVDRLKALGNAVVPQIPEMIGRAILETEHPR
ncbi:MAG: DNA cytosine methyltransferase [Herbaspirillum sp.]|nr:DNA cytosine methyltransferase [Herbaspirillum sp.]